MKTKVKVWLVILMMAMAMPAIACDGGTRIVNDYTIQDASNDIEKALPPADGGQLHQKWCEFQSGRAGVPCSD